MLNTPVLFLVFNRLDTTKQVFAKIREIQPKQLFIGADGARAGKEGEVEKVKAVRQYILDNIDWDCEVKTLFREQNLGCGVAPAEAITWFFENVEQGIILEDDCLPDLSFFTFCEELLDYYKGNEQIMHITGNNFQFGKKRGHESYYFSKYTHNWGWATWRRAWKHMDFDMATYPIFLAELEKHDYLFTSEKEKKYWLNEFSKGNINKNHVWDLQWLYSVWKNDGVTICPNHNLVSNIGFGIDATHTIQESHISKGLPSAKISRIIHSNLVKINMKADNYVFRKHFHSKTTFKNILRNILYKIFPQSLFKTWRKIKKHTSNA